MAKTPATGGRDEERLWREFGRYLEGLRIDRGLSRQQLVDKTRPAPNDKPAVSYHALMFLEAGGRTVEGEWVTPNPRDPQLVALAHAIGVPVDRFYAKVGRYADRPRTKASRTGAGLRAARENLELRDRLDRNERLIRRIADKLGVDLDELEAELEAEPSDEPPRRRRRPAG